MAHGPSVSIAACHNTDAGPQAVAALQDANLSIAAGESVAIIGASGSGKSTLLHVLTGLTGCDQGTIRIGDQDLSQLNDDQLAAFRRQHIGIVFQQFNLVPVLSAVENVALPQLLDGANRNDALARATSALEAVGLEARADHTPDQLSGGEQQRVAIARALINEASLLVADEPTGNLDSQNAERITKLLVELGQQAERTLILVTHASEVAALCQRIVVLADGKIIGTITDHGGDPATVAQQYRACLQAAEQAASEKSEQASA